MTRAGAGRAPVLQYTVEPSQDRKRWALRVMQITWRGLFDWSDCYFQVFRSAQAAHAARRRLFPTAEASR